jgi:hypothetical protein
MRQQDHLGMCALELSTKKEAAEEAREILRRRRRRRLEEMAQEKDTAHKSKNQ